MASLSEDPTVLTYLRALGFEESAAKATAQQRTDDVQRRVAFTQPQIEEQGIEQRRDIELGAEGRGLLSSGATQRDLALQTRDETNRVGNLQLAGAEQIGGIQSDLLSQVAALQRQQAERNLSLAQSQYLQQGQLEPLPQQRREAPLAGY